MEIDSLLMFDNGETLTTSRDSTKTLDFVTPGDEIEKTFALVVQGHNLVKSGAKIKVSLMTDDGTESWKKLATFEDVPIADANKTGYIVKFGALPYGIKRFLKINYEVTSGPLEGGTVTAFLTRSRIID